MCWIGVEKRPFFLETIIVYTGCGSLSSSPPSGCKKAPQDAGLSGFLWLSQKKGQQSFEALLALLAN